MPTVVTDDGVTLAYSTHGSGAKTLLFIHPWGGSKEFWDDVLPLLDLSKLKAICVDLRGHGASEQAAQGYTFPRMTRDLLQIADHAGVWAFVPVGFSLGGRLSQFLAASAPERIPAQILLCCSGPDEMPGMTQEIVYSILDATSSPERLRPFWVPTIKNWERPARFEAWLASVARTPRHVLEPTGKMSVWNSIVEHVRVTRAQTLVIAGEADPITGPGYQREGILKVIPRARLVTLDCGHFPTFECPEKLVIAVESFLKEIGGFN